MTKKDPIAVKTEHAKDKLEALLKDGPLTIHNARTYDGSIYGAILYRAALGLIRDGKAVLIHQERTRISMGPKPYTKFRTAVTIAPVSPDAI